MDAANVIYFVFVFLLIILFFLIIPYKVAKKRGRSGIGWVIFSIFFSPIIGVIFLFLLGETDRKRRQRIEEEEFFRNEARDRF